MSGTHSRDFSSIFRKRCVPQRSSPPTVSQVACLSDPLYVSGYVHGTSYAIQSIWEMVYNVRTVQETDSLLEFEVVELNDDVMPRRRRQQAPETDIVALMPKLEEVGYVSRFTKRQNVK
jgi:hypothetical protein